MSMCNEIGSSAPDRASRVKVLFDAYAGPEKNVRVLGERRNSSKLPAASGGVRDRFAGRRIGARRGDEDEHALV
jgi:hypothetical protein